MGTKTLCIKEREGGFGVSSIKLYYKAVKLDTARDRFIPETNTLFIESVLIQLFFKILFVFKE